MPAKLILIIEDDFRIARLVAEVLDEAGYATQLVPDLDAARAFQASGGTPSGIISDLLVEGSADPAGLTEAIASIFPGAPLTLMTGVPPNRRAHLGVTHDRVLEKPFELAALLSSVSAMVGSPTP